MVKSPTDKKTPIKNNAIEEENKNKTRCKVKLFKRDDKNNSNEYISLVELGPNSVVLFYNGRLYKKVIKKIHQEMEKSHKD